MKKLNLMFAVLAVGVLALSLVSAGITGYYLKIGDAPLQSPNKVVSSIDMNTQTAVIGGRRFGVGDFVGKDQIVAIKKPFLGKPKIVFEKTNNVGPALTKTTNQTGNWSTNQTTGCTGTQSFDRVKTNSITNCGTDALTIWAPKSIKVSTDPIYGEAILLESNTIAFNGSDDIVFVSPDDVQFDGPGSIRINALSGNGNAYACLDSGGTLFRSNTPCN